jgi:hypothetical protein
MKESNTMTHNERLAIVETEIRHISETTKKIVDILEKHVEREESYLSKVEAVKLYAPKSTQIDLHKTKNRLNWVNGLLITTLLGVILLMLELLLKY